MKRGAFCLAPLVFLLLSCGRYADFTLPEFPARVPAIQFSVRLEPEPALPHGAPGEWDARDALNPSMVRRDGLYYNFYSGFDGRTWHTGLATSPDGVRWEKRGRVLSPAGGTWEGDYIAANGSALYRDGEFLYWYQAGPKARPRIGLARSRNGIAWAKWDAPVLETGPRGSWDERGVADPFVIHRDGLFYMYYLGQDRARRQRLGLARSRDGLHWQKLRTNPVLELGETGGFDEEGLGEPAVWAWGSFYWMLYTGRDRHENRRLGLAVSRDGVHWSRLPTVVSGPNSWNEKVICDPEVEVQDRLVRLWFGGGNVAGPDENLNGQIGVGVLTPTPLSRTARPGR